MKLALPNRLPLHSAAVVALAPAGYIAWYGLRFVFSDIAETRGQEPLILTGIMKVLAGRALYTHPNEAPFDMMQYTPLYYYLVAWLARAAGYHAGDAVEITRLGRGLSGAFALAAFGAFLLVLVRVLRVRPALALVAASTVWILHAPWDFLARPDALVSLCFISAIGLTLSGLRRAHEDWRADASFACAAFLGFVAFMAKQNGAQICVVLGIFFTLQREWRRACVVAASAGIPLLLAMWLGPRLFGTDYLANAVGGLDNGVRIGAAFRMVYNPIFLDLNMAALTAIGAYIAWSWAGSGVEPPKRFLAFALAVVFVLAAFSATKLGSAAHHYNDYMTLLILCIAYWLDESMLEAKLQERAVSRAIAAFAALFAVNATVAFHDAYEGGRWVPFANYQGPVAYLEEELQAHPENDFFTIDYTLANYFPGRAVIPQYSLSAIMHARGAVDYANAQDMMQSGRIRWLLLGDGQNPERQLGFVGIDPGRYQRIGTLDGFSIWLHAGVSESTASELGQPQSLSEP